MTYDTGGLGRGAGETSRRTPFLILSRAVGYLIVPLYVAGVCATYLLERGAGLREEAGLIGIIETALLNVGLGAFAVVGALLVVRRSANPIGWFLLLALTFVYLPLLFPDGRLLSRRWLPVAVVAGISPMIVVLRRALVDTIPVNEAPGYKIDNPIGIEGLSGVENLPVNGVLNTIFFVGFAGVVASVVVRFRRSRGVERRR